MASKRDYYDILGIPKTSSDEDIKKAYRKLAREHHPDMVAAEGKADAEKRFKELNEAYQVLSDPEKKRMYDQFGTTDGNPFGGQWGPFNAADFGFDPFDIFEEVFGFRGFGGARRPRRGKNLYYEMHVDFADAVKGAEKEVDVESGRIKIKIPKGARDGVELRFVGKGAAGPNGVPAGDLFISLRVPTPREFRRSGDDLVTAVSIDFAQAALGDNVEAFVVDEKSASGVSKAKIKIPTGTQPGTQLRLRGKGMPRLRGSGNGDVIVQVFVEIPKKLSKKQREALENYQNA